MSKSQSNQRVLAQAKEKEKRYEWLDAVEFHKKALDQMLKQNDFLKVGEVEERIGYCLHRAAMQGESREEFEERMQLAIEEYEKACGFYEKLKDEQKAGARARMLRCKALTKYLGYWLTPGPSEKRKLLDDSLELEGKALELFFNNGAKLEYGRTFNALSQIFFERSVLEWNRQILRSVIERGMEWGQKAVRLLTELDDSYEIARALLTLGTVIMCDLFGFYFIAELEKQEQHRLKAVEHMRSAIEFSERVGDSYVKGLSYGWLGLCSGGEESTRYYQKSIDCGKETRDNYLQAFALNLLAYFTYWEAFTIEDQEQRRNQAERAMKFYDKAQHHFSVLSYQSPRWGLLAAPGGYAEHYLHLAEWETDPKKKLDLLVMSEKTGIKALKVAEDSDIPLIVSAMLHVLSKTLEARAKFESDSDVKRSCLEKAMKHRERAIEITERVTPYNYWDQGVELACLAGINAELGGLEQELDSKKKLFEEAASNLERSLGLMAKAMLFYEKMGRLDLFSSIYKCQDSYVMLLTQLHELTGNLDYLRKAIEVSTRAIESASKLEMVSLIAESYWKIAKTEDVLGEYVRAAEDFKNASEAYVKASEKIPQLGAFYRDYAFYMQAWTQIEKAKHHHVKKQYGQAKEDYMKTAELHDSTERWNYLGPNYLAWAKLEEAEDLSRREQSQEASDLFQRAASLFVEAKKSIQAKLEKIAVTEEKTMAAELVKASDVRREYCLGRIALEEAKILDRQGDHTESSKKYGSAAEIFKEIAEVESERSRKELQQIIFLCQAWQKMMMAEAKTSSTMYGEAAELFKQAKEYTIDQPTSLLALAHSSFSKALQAETTFEATRDTSTYLVAKKHMEAAENYYLKAGFQNASEYAKATYMLFDAYMYMHKAETETDPAKKAQYYRMAEKLLQTSAGSYMKAKHPEKSEEVQRLLESVREKRQLAVSLIEVLHAPTVTGTTTSFSTPTPTHEKAVGLERFEHTVIEAYLTASEEVTVEEQMEVRLDLVNVAKESGLLVRVDDLVPPSFKVTAPPSQYSTEDGSINMKGKKIGPLKVETIKLNLQAIEPGVVNLNPQVIYVDDVGKFRTSKPEPVAITVHPKLAFEFKTKAAKNAFDFLTTSFVEDYMKRRLSLEKSGWRTLMDIIRHGKVSKSSVYGSGGRRGRAVSELERRGLVETRVFLGERGRGGKILRMRISYDKETIKRHIDQRIMKIKEK